VVLSSVLAGRDGRVVDSSERISNPSTAAKVEVVFTHNNMDFDSLAAQYAVSKLYPSVKMVLGYPLGGNVRRFISLYRSSLPIVQVKYLDLSKVSRAFIVDCQHADRIDENARKLLAGEFGKACPYTIFDHHEIDPKGLMPGAQKDSIIEQVGSSTTILVDKLRLTNVELNSFEATLLATGIYEDTGSLTYSGTTERDALCVAYLLRHGADLAIVAEHTRPKLSDELSDLLETLLDNARRLEINGARIVVSHAQLPKYLDGLASLTRKLVEIESADAGFTVVHMRDRVHIVGRSDSRALDVRPFVRAFGGDGHHGAGSAVAKNVSVDYVVDRIEEMAFRVTRPEITAREIMSSPVRTVKSNISMSEASRIMLRYGVDGLLVTENDKVEGVVSRRDIDQAAHHKLGHAPVLGFMSRPVLSISPDTSLSKIQEVMVKEDIGRLPVLDGEGHLLGLVSRQDVLKTLYGGEQAGKAAVWTVGGNAGFGERQGTLAGLPRINLAVRLQTLDQETQWVCEQVGKSAAQLNMVAYAVGGFVRDLLLNVPNFDLDFVIEGSAGALAEQLQKDYPGKFEVKVQHERFKTAHLCFLRGEARSPRDVDFSTARTEFYEYPAALPTVEPSELEQDLLRRDFTINALAVCLNPERFGELIDLFGGLSDIEHKMVRILHAFSFIEDPTRLIRAARFAARLGFAIGDKTMEQAQRAVSMGIFDDLGGVRLRDELKMILESEHRLQALDLLAQVGAKLRYLDSELEYKPSTRKLLRITERLLRKYPVKEPWIVYLGVLLSELPVARLQAVLDRLHLSNDQKNIVTKALELPSGMPDLFESVKWANYQLPKRSHIYRMLSGKPDESLAIAAGIARPGSPMRRIIRVYLGELEKTHLDISGKDVLALGLPEGPKIGQVLQTVFEAKLDGGVSSREDEIRFAHALILAGDGCPNLL
jgi:tRNA nucleotidyltransferase (CCA-adding enzyme)